MVKETNPQSNSINIFDDSYKLKPISFFDKQILQYEESFIFDIPINQPRADISQQTQAYTISRNISNSSRFDIKDEDIDLDQYFSFPCSQHDIKTAPLSSSFEKTFANSNTIISSNLNSSSDYFPANSKPLFMGESKIPICDTQQQQLFELHQEALYVDQKLFREENDIIHLDSVQTLIKSNSINNNNMEEEKNTIENEQSLQKKLINIPESKRSKRISTAINKLQAKKRQVIDAPAGNQTEEYRMFEETKEEPPKSKRKQSGGINQTKQNIYKSIMNAFRGFAAQKNQIKLLFSKITADNNTNIDNQIKQLQRYLRKRSFNYHILKYLMDHKIYCVLFKHFIMVESTSWLEKSKVDNKQLAVEVIDLLKRCLEDRELLGKFKCYKRGRKTIREDETKLDINRKQTYSI